MSWQGRNDAPCVLWHLFSATSELSELYCVEVEEIVHSWFDYMYTFERDV